MEGGLVEGSNQGFEPGPELFDGVEVWAIRRKKEQANASLYKYLGEFWAFVK